MIQEQLTETKCLQNRGVGGTSRYECAHAHSHNISTGDLEF